MHSKKKQKEYYPLSVSPFQGEIKKEQEWCEKVKITPPWER
jgi:hypothetical protein